MNFFCETIKLAMNLCLLQLLSISFSLTCLFDGIQGQSCPALESPLYGSLSGPCLTNPGSTCSIRCNPSFEALGSCARVCQPNGSWTGLPLICLNRAITCPPLTLPEKLSMGGPCFNVAGGICRFGCPVDTTLLGPESIYCTNMGSWSASPPSCSPNGCPPLQALENGQLTGMCGIQGSQSSDSNIVSGSTCRLSCPYCTILNGPSSISCLPSGQWDGSLGTCSPINCPDIANTATPDFITSQGNCNNARCDDICTFRCDVGYEIQGSSSLICGPNGQWNQPVPRCIQSKCPDWSVPTGGLFINECPEGLNCPSLCPGIPNQRCKLRCGAGYRLVGTTEEVICTPITLQWSQALPTCEPIR